MPPADAVRDGRPLGAQLQISPGAVVLGLCLPLLFLHVRYQPSVGLPLGATLKLQDAAVIAIAIAAAVRAVRGGVAPLRAARPLWIATLLFLAWIVAATFYPLLSARAYAWRTHLVTAVEFGLYALLAPAVPLLVRRRADALAVLGVLVAWSSAATLVGVVQWLGWDIVGAWPQGRRQPSFLGPHDFAALSGMTLLLGIVALFWQAKGTAVRRGAWLAVAAGAIGFVLGGASAGVLGLVPAVLFAAVVAARRAVVGRRILAATLATAAVACLGVVVLRAGDFSQFFGFLGVRQAETSASTDIQTYSQRTLLAYIGVRIWLHHPIAGAGWQGSTEESVVGPELPAAHRRFPDLAARAFPGPGHEYGVQILYLQALADLGIVGFALTVGWLGVAVAAGARTALRAPPNLAWVATLGVCWLGLALGLWAAMGLVAGIPLDALGWLAIGTIAAGMGAAGMGAAGTGAVAPADSGRIRR